MGNRPATLYENSATPGAFCLTVASRRLSSIRDLPGRLPAVIALILWISIGAAMSRPTQAATGAPLLISQPTSTRAIALESLCFTSEPFALTSSCAWGPDRQTRVMLFAVNLSLQPGETASAVTADAEDANHQHYNLTVEYVAPLPNQEWLTVVVIKLRDELRSAGDVLVRVSYGGTGSNRVRLGVGQIGGGPADDPGAAPTLAPPYSIGGQLFDHTGQPLGGVTINLTGAETKSAITGGDGRYSLTVNKVGDYTLTPVTTAYEAFVPQAIQYLHQNQIANFPGTLRYYTVRGYVHLGPNNASNFTLQITGSLTTTVTTDANGDFAISLPAGGDYAFTPSLTLYDFAPSSQVVTDLSSNQINRNFSGTRESFTISGNLINEQSQALAGITVHLSGAPEPRISITNSAGRYEFPDLTAGYDYTITPDSNSTYVFTPHSFTDLRSNLAFDFTGLRRLILHGTVRDGSGNPLIGVRVTLGGSESGNAVTAADGSYSLGVISTGNYMLTPSVGQDWYAFTPTGWQVTNITNSQVVDFAGTLAPIPATQSVLEFDTTPKTVDYGNFWEENTDLGHFYWEFWARPGPYAGATYVLSDGYGGAHALLFGVGSFNTSEPARYELLGDIFDGVKFDNYFGSDVGPAIGEWAHLAVGWDGQNIITYYNGVPVGKTPFHGPRRTPGPGGGGGRLLIGGSDHSNFEGRIAQVRGFENVNPLEGVPGGVESAFAPRTVFGLGGNLLSYYFRPGTRVADLSPGYNGSAHEGIARGTTAGILFDCGACPPPQFVIDPSAPNFATGVPPQPVNLPTPANPPNQALVFDSFSRRNSTYIFGGYGGLGLTESGSTGPQIWRTDQTFDLPQPFGILNARAVLLGSSTAVAWVPTGSANVDVRVNRYKGRWGSGIHTGVSFRVVDSANFFFAYTADSSDSQGKVLHVGYYQNGNRVDLASALSIPSEWLTLRVITRSSGELQVYIDGTLVYDENKPALASATGAGLYSDSVGKGLTNRWDNFTVFAAP